MRKNLLLMITVLLLIEFSFSWKPTRQFKFKNNCNKTIWIGAFGVPLMSQTGWEMPPQS